MNSDTLLNVWSDLLQDLGSKEHDTGRSVTDLGILSTSNIDKSARSRVNNIEELEQGGTVICLSAYHMASIAHWR